MTKLPYPQMKAMYEAAIRNTCKQIFIETHDMHLWNQDEFMKIYDEELKLISELDEDLEFALEPSFQVH